jgi:16S rRNA (guanine966-N2)-methyltransferase
MRISGGSERGRRVAAPQRSGTRPTAGRVKQALFNILSSRTSDARFLDLYAGTGLVGLEALSRGAGHAAFVESDAGVCRQLKKTLESCGYNDRSKVYTMKAERFVNQPVSKPYDVVFVDPPYHSDELDKMLPSLGANAIIAPGGVVVIEHFHKIQLPAHTGHLIRGKSYRYGNTFLTMYHRNPAQESP